MMFDIKLNDVHSSPKERQLQKTCVSFGEECKCFHFLTSLQTLCLEQFNHKLMGMYGDGIASMIQGLYAGY